MLAFLISVDSLLRRRSIKSSSKKGYYVRFQNSTFPTTENLKIATEWLRHAYSIARRYAFMFKLFELHPQWNLIFNYENAETIFFVLRGNAWIGVLSGVELKFISSKVIEMLSKVPCYLYVISINYAIADTGKTTAVIITALNMINVDIKECQAIIVFPSLESVYKVYFWIICIKVFGCPLTTLSMDFAYQ